MPISGNGNMPHVLLSAPSTTPGRWMLCIEDLNGGGDRDFNDVIFMFRTPTQSRVRSLALGSDDTGCALSRVRFPKDDVLQGVCLASAFTISYSVATDCCVCDAGSCLPIPALTWHPLPLPPGPEATLVDLSNTPGSQL